LWSNLDSHTSQTSGLPVLLIKEDELEIFIIDSMNANSGLKDNNIKKTIGMVLMGLGLQDNYFI
jgi:hypothetical protein